MTITPEIKAAVEQAGGEPVRLEDPESHEAYILLREDAYRRLASLLGLDSGPPSIEEQRAALAHAGRRAGWDDPAMDVYNALDPRRKP